MSTWLLRNAATTNTVGHNNKTTGIIDTFANTRYYNSFDTSTVTMALGDIATVELIVKVTANVGTETYKCHSAISSDANWGATLVADNNDWTSTAAHLESSLSIGSTGVKSFSIDKNNIDLSGTTYIRLMSSAEAVVPDTKSITIASTNNATAADRPFLRFTSTSGAVQDIIGIGFIPFAR